MFIRILHNNIKNSCKSDKNRKRKCLRIYIKHFLASIHHKIWAPLMWIIWYIKRNQIANDIYNYYKVDLRYKHVLLLSDDTNIDAFFQSLNKIRITGDAEKYLMLINLVKTSLTKWQYRLFYYGEFIDINDKGDTPDWYMPNCKYQLWRRFNFTAIRNAGVQGDRMEMITGVIVSVKDRYDNRDLTKIYKNRGTGNTALGQALEWYEDINDNLWFYYESTKKTGRLFYAGYNSRCNRPFGQYFLSFAISNRTCEPAGENAKPKTNLND